MLRMFRFTRTMLISGLLITGIPALSQDTSHDVIVVGAGSAGLKATKSLLEKNYKVLIIEATDRIGGRVYSTTLGSTRIELGAEEHYTAKGDNPVWDPMVKTFGKKIFTKMYANAEAYSMDQGKNTCWTISKAPRDCADDPDFQVYEDAVDSWYWDPGQHKDSTTNLAEDLLNDFGVDRNHRAYHLYDHSFALGNYATNLHRLGARSLALQDNQCDLSGAVYGINDAKLGYSDALNVLWWNKVVNHKNSDLLLNHPVTEIDTTGDDVIVTDKLGNRHAARQVIVTVSIGVLQAEIIKFLPALPKNTVAAYNGIGIDKGMKVPMRFRSAWWETQKEPMDWLVTEGLATACWPPTNYKKGSVDHILMCYPMGDNAKALDAIANNAGGGKMGEKAIINTILKDLDRTLPKAPGAATRDYIDGMVQNWGMAPYTRGAYSYAKIGTFETKNRSKRKDLQQPVANNRIFFAGEATHITHPATVVGALHEGERVAEAVGKVNGSPLNPPPLP